MDDLPPCVTVLLERRVEDRLQDLAQALPDQPVQYRQNAEHPTL
jgi:hypothetical protein